jgi:transposase
MLSLPSSVRVFAARERVDFRKGFDGLCAIVRDHFGDDPLSGHLYLFFNRRANRLKILVWDRNGFWIFYKRLERGVFERIDGAGARIEIDRARLAMLLDGIDTKKSELRKHFVRDVRLNGRVDEHDRHARAAR